MREHVRRMAEEVVAAHPGAGIDELNRLLAQSAAAYNRTAQPDMAGLSPEQVRRLLYGPWEGDEAALIVRQDLLLDELRGSATLHNALAMMREMQRCGAVKATANGNLNRAFVMAVARQMRLDPLWETELTRKPSALNEADLPELHTLRHVLRLAGLIRLAWGSFHLTKKGTALLPDERAGELQALLFHTTFRKLNLAVLTPYDPEIPIIQDVVAYSLYVLHRLDSEWHEVPDVVLGLLPPGVRDRLVQAGSGEDLRWMVRRMILTPCVDLGLLDLDDPALREVRGRGTARVRKAHVLDRMLQFRL